MYADVDCVAKVKVGKSVLATYSSITYADGCCRMLKYADVCWSIGGQERARHILVHYREGQNAASHDETRSPPE
jgi:hypothetical protein